MIGEGVAYSADRQKFGLLVDEKFVRDIDKCTASRIAMSLGLSEPEIPEYRKEPQTSFCMRSEGT